MQGVYGGFSLLSLPGTLGGWVVHHQEPRPHLQSTRDPRHGLGDAVFSIHV